MATLLVNGRKVKVDDSFKTLSPDQQEAAIEEIAQSLGAGAGGAADQEGPSMRAYEPSFTENLSYNAQQLADSLGVGPSMEQLRTSLGQINSGMVGASQGITGNFSDEIIAGIKTGAGLWGDYGDQLAKERAFLELNRIANPTATLAGNVAGALALGGGAIKSGASFLPRAANAPLATRMLAGSKEGAAYGALYGAGGGEGTDGKALGALTGALSGGVIGGAIPAVASGFNVATKPVRDAITARFAPDQFAARKTAERLSQDGIDIQQAARQLETNPGLAVADLGGENTRALLRSAVNVPGPGKNRVKAALTLRQMGQGSRLNSLIERTFSGPKGYFEAKDEIAAQAKAIAAPLYEQAYANPVPFTRELEAILNTPAGKDGLRKAINIAGNEQAPFKQWFINVADDGTASVKRVPDMRAWDYIKRGLDDVIEGQTDKMTGKVTTSGRAVIGLKNRLLNALDAANPAYGEARRVAAQGFQLDDAVEFGRKAYGMSAESIARKFKDFSEAERQAARIGYAEALRSRIEGAGWTHNKLLQVVKSKEQFAALKAMFPNQKAFGEFRSAIFNEARKQKTLDAVRGNSTTAAQLLDAADSRQLSEGVGAAADLFTGNATGFLSKASSLFQRLGGMTPQVADSVSRRLLEQNPAAVRGVVSELARIENSAMSAAQRSAQIQALISRVTAMQATELAQ